MDRVQLLEHLQSNTRVLKTPRIREAFEKIDRADFILPEYRGEAYEDYPLPIGQGQTISQPTTVAFMLELLAPKRGQKILDVGCGSGWTSALLAEVVGEKGSVLGLERVPELVAFGQKNLGKYHFLQARIERAGEELGRASEAPFDRILVSAAAEKLPETLIEQLALEGVMVVPVRDAIVKITKNRNGTLETKRHEGFAFVPLIERKT
ncbi:protein-L-isoaspartate O-methyltransferase [Candidatus Kaiserbacteria bacterium RIFCSPHIGHO2_01_FULL_51_33]|uniref:Protein-L-isoaspartate O-methyltransferase n=1 Tax=Candidatus Kaiserbacteria bacterium RIFCSPLOWO2_01_FULL_51_21 TaxID=1798508 RepID=A0A1F6EDK8_9BACT|nr:MAG: protein-L-isoaspartate O-methyltransferase [Candidatus Kaiserbacteria bacterium RIFCSPHIGHO2_01_FULL_51_33]OGG71726.1 MAG: protein-L-isoaspartate O-methyltransferase [Candidatus Kaiserbacteria bacterium RIFCSPLOWO2_01_FULL_51_21]